MMVLVCTIVMAPLLRLLHHLEQASQEQVGADMVELEEKI
jgi:hypothetical protein